MAPTAWHNVGVADEEAHEVDVAMWASLASRVAAH